MDREYIRPAFERGAKSSPIGSKYARSMGFVNHEHAAVPEGNRREVGKRRSVAIHAIKAFGCDPRTPPPASGAPAADLVLEIVCVIMPGRRKLRAARTHSVMHA